MPHALSIPQSEIRNSKSEIRARVELFFLMYATSCHKTMRTFHQYSAYISDDTNKIVQWCIGHRSCLQIQWTGKELTRRLRLVV
jgi:hypothetical protein